MVRHRVDPRNLDEGIRNAVVLLWKGGFRTFTSCEGGRGHSFQHETIGLELEGNYAAFQRRLVRFLRSHGMESFTISLVSDYHPDHPQGKRWVYLEGLDILSEEKRGRVVEAVKRRERRLRRQARAITIPAPPPKQFPAFRHRPYTLKHGPNGPNRPTGIAPEER